MEARIRYARTSDGVAIAFWSFGDGPAIVHMPWAPWSHVQLEARNADFHRWYARLGREHKIVRYDGRGSGLSDRPAGPQDLEAQVGDLDAVVNRLGLERFALFAPFNMGPAGITYTFRRPERVSHLVLWCAYARGADYLQAPEVQAIRSLLGQDWELYTETGAHSFVGWDEGASAHQLARLMQESCTAEEASRFLLEMSTSDCSALLPRIKVPVLVMQPRGLPLISLDIARALASAIPDSRLVLFEGDSLAPQVVDNDGVAGAIEEFMAEAGSQAAEGVVASDPGPEDNPDGLTEREIEVLRLLARGQSNREIADTLVISPRTVERHIANAYTKINANNRVQASVYASSHSIA